MRALTHEIFACLVQAALFFYQLDTLPTHNMRCSQKQPDAKRHWKEVVFDGNATGKEYVLAGMKWHEHATTNDDE